MSGSPLGRWRLWPVALLAALLPLELDAVMVEIAGVQLRTAQLFGLGVVLVAALSAARRSLSRVPMPAWVIGGAYVGGTAVSWLFGDVFEVNMRLTAVRLLMPPLVMIAVVALLAGSRSPGVRMVVRALLGGGVAAALIGIAAWIAGGDVWFSDSFRGTPTSLGPYPRLTRPFNHANVAAMYLAPVSILWLAQLGDGWARRRLVMRVAPAFGAIVCGFAALATYSRMVPIALVLGVAVLGAAGIIRGRGLWAVGSAVVAGIALFVGLAPGWDARLGSPGRQAWYGSEIEILDRPGSSIPAGGGLMFDAIVTNRSTVRWEAEGAERVRLSLRWRSVDDDLQYGEDRFDLPAPLDPGASTTVVVESSRPVTLAPGEYRIVVDLLRDREAYFQEVLGGATTVDFSGGTAAVGATGREVRRPLPELARTDLWRAAWGLGVSRPLVGVGPGNFRLLYGDELGLAEAPRGSHAHSLILESFASTGIVVTGAIVATFAALALDAGRRHGRRRLAPLEAGVLAALAMMGVQGLVDWPLIFSSTGWLYWLLLAIWVQLGRADASEEVTSQ